MKRVFKWINNNGILSSIAATIIVGIVIYITNRNFKLLTYSEIIHEEIYNPSVDSYLIIFSADSSPVVKNLYLLELDFWNQGNVPIEYDDIKLPIKITLDSIDQIIQPIKIIESHPDLLKLKTEINDSSHSINSKFEFMDKGIGFKLRLFYEANDKCHYKITSYIKGQLNIKSFDDSFWSKSKIWILLIIFVIPIIVTANTTTLILRLENKIFLLLHLHKEINWQRYLGLLLVALLQGFTVYCFLKFYFGS